MIFSPIRYLITGLIIGAVIMALSSDYVIVDRRRYEKLRRNQK